MIRNGPLKIPKSLTKAENGPFGKNLFPITDSYTKLLTLIKPGRSFYKNFIPIAKQSLLKLKPRVCRHITDLLDKPNGFCPNTINMRDNACFVKG